MAKTPPRKIFDILPPERYKKELPEIEKEKAEKLKKPSRSSKRVFLLIALILIIAISLSYFFFQRLTLIMWPETQEVSFSEKIIVDKNLKENNFLSKTIPGELFSKEQVTPQEFNSSGRTSKETKAGGVIRVYNAYSTSPQALMVRTRFVSAEGKLFRSLEGITIPGGTYEGGKLQAGLLDVKVEADQPGPEYNIGPSTFSIPGFAGTPKYTAFYGKSSEPMKGGSKGEGTEVTQNDLDEAEKRITEKSLKELESSLKNSLSGDYVLLEGATKKENQSPVFSAKVGDDTSSFTGEIKGTIKALAFKKSDLEKIAKDLIIAKISQDQKLKEDSLNIKYSPETIDLEGGKMILTLDISSTIYTDFNKESFKREISGKTVAEVESILKSNFNIKRFEINIWPPWPRKFPEDPRKIKIEVRL